MASGNGVLPAPLSRAARRFETWRSRNGTRRRIPDDLWRMAAGLAGRYGVNRTARALRLDYYRVKQHADGTPARDPEKPAAPSRFVEILPTLPAPAPTCLVEFEDPRGSKMRVHLPGGDPGAVVALGRLFLEGRA
jgi:hypothetical protein